MNLPQPHATLLKFGYPETLVHQGEHWALLVRPAQPTLGSLVLCSLSDATAYGALPAAAFAEQGMLIARIEELLRAVCQPEKINYLMLMMVDPHVHFHIIPRYAGERRLGDTGYPDSGWPSIPDLTRTVTVSSHLLDQIRTEWTSLAEKAQ